MSRSLNKAMLIGNVGKDPELKKTPSGIPVISFRLATHDSRRDKEGIHQEYTDWHTIVAWRGLATLVSKIVMKGTRVYVEGKIQTRVYENKTGIRKNVVEILADNILVLDNKKKRDQLDMQEDINEIDEIYSFDEDNSNNNDKISNENFSDNVIDSFDSDNGVANKNSDDSSDTIVPF